MTNSIFNLQNYFFNPFSLPHFIMGILVMVEGIFVFTQSRKSILHTAYLLITISSGIWLTGVGFLGSSSDEAIAVIWSRYYSWLGIIFVTPAVYLFSVAWDDEMVGKKIKFVYLNYLTALVFYLICISSGYLVEGVWPYSTGFFPKAGILEPTFLIWFYALVAISLVNFVHTYQKETIPIRRKNTKLMFIAFAIAFCSSVEYLPNYGINIFPVAFFTMFVFISVMGYCVIRYKLMDIETVIHKTIMWLATTVVFLAPVAILSYFLHGAIIETKPFLFASIILAYSCLFIPYIRYVQPLIDQWFQRGQRNLTQVFTKFMDELVHLKSLEDLSRHILQTIRQAIYPEDVKLLLWDQEKRECVAFANDGKSVNINARNYENFFKSLTRQPGVVLIEYVDFDPYFKAVREEAHEYLNSTNSKVCVPLILNEHLIGTINLSRKVNLKRYSAAEIRFLSELKGSAAIAISNSLRLIAMQASLRKWNEELEKQVEARTRELKEAQAQLLQAEKLATIGTLAGGVAHEINNPLAVILTNAQMLLTENLSADTKESLELVEQAAERCRIIVQQLMKYSRKSGNSETSELIDLKEVISHTISFLSYQLEQENIKILNGAAQSVCVAGNANEFSQVFTNLIVNARDALKNKKTGAEIKIELYEKNGSAVVDVTDNGVGISPEIISKIFDPFFTTKDVGKGTGLGLSIAQGIVQKYGGKIEVKSEVNIGTTVSVSFVRTQSTHSRTNDKGAVSPLKNIA